MDNPYRLLQQQERSLNLHSILAKSEVCNSKVLPSIVQRKIKEYEKGEQNKIRSIRTLYEGSLLSKREYTAKRNCGDNTRDDPRTASSSEFMQGCEIPKLLPYKKLMSVINGIDIKEVKD